MANLLDFLGALRPNEDGTPNALQRFNQSINPEQQMQQLKMQGLMQELQQKQAVQSALQQWATKGGGDPKSLYGALAATGDPSYLSKFTDLVSPKPQTTTIGGNVIQFDENNPETPPKVIYSQKTADERKQDAEEKDKADQLKAQIVKAKDVLSTIHRAQSQVAQPLTSGAQGKIGTFIPGSTAYDLDATLQTIKSNLGFDELAKMRLNSPTGASGLGALNKAELDALQSGVSNLKVGQTDEQLGENIGKVKTHYINWLAQQGVKTAINPKTGEVKILMDGKWQ